MASFHLLHKGLQNIALLSCRSASFAEVSSLEKQGCVDIHSNFISISHTCNVANNMLTDESSWHALLPMGVQCILFLQKILTMLETHCSPKTEPLKHHGTAQQGK